MQPNAKLFWSEEDEGWIAVDPSRPGCSAWGATMNDVVKELQDARKAWDMAKAEADKMANP